MRFLDYFERNTCNSIEDVSGFKQKLSMQSRRWEGYMVSPKNYEERQPQDFPVTPRAARVYSQARPNPPVKVYTPPNPSDL